MPSRLVPWSSSVVCALLVSSSLLSLTGCNTNEEPYKPMPAFSGRKPSLPPVPTLASNPKKASDGSYTIFGAIHDLKSRIHSSEITGKDAITITGYIVQTNYDTAPKCLQHPTGKKDPDNCPPPGMTNEIPSFWIADQKGDTKGQKIRVLGWAKNWATIFDAMKKYSTLKEVKDPAKDLVKDDVWSVDVPFPLPAVDAQVKVTGKYGYTFTKSSTGLVSDPANGVMTYQKIEYTTPPPAPAAFASTK
ncbi:MAG TPA: hypothetical protein VGI39_30755 [Polyangiaceae bacterium]|jgi:hypothetical protein